MAVSAVDGSGEAGGPFIDSSRLDLRRYARRSSLAMVLADYLIFVERNPRKVRVTLPSAAVVLCSFSHVDGTHPVHLHQKCFLQITGCITDIPAYRGVHGSTYHERSCRRKAHAPAERNRKIERTSYAHNLDGKRIRRRTVAGTMLDFRSERKRSTSSYLCYFQAFSLFRVWRT